MNDYQFRLYNNLMRLVQSNEAFYFQDFQLDGSTYRIFNYRLASYTDFQQPSALECRGVMFEIGGVNQSVLRLASLPMEKFFNLNENPSTMGLDLTTVVEIQEKADGSLMSTYLHYNPKEKGHVELRLKSKGSLFSDQALAAMKWLDNQPEFKQRIEHLATLGYTVNLEWCSPEHRIVLGYLEPSLKVLNVRNDMTGEYLEHHGYFCKADRVESKFANLAPTIPFDPIAFVQSIPQMQDVEGFVVRLASGQRVKIKTEWYLSLHHAKDSVNNPRRLFEAILDEGIDDLRSMFYTDALAMQLIDEMQAKVDHLYNEMVKTVEAYYEQNKHLSRKDYAIKGQQELQQLYFGLAMNKYSGKSFDYKAFLKSKWKELGLRDTSVDKSDE